MALVNDPQNSNSLFSAINNQYNINKQSSGDIQDIIKSLNIIDPSTLTKDQLSIILKRIDDYSGFFSTQQLDNIDYRKFNQHVFFDSAVNKVSYAFDRIHTMPYDKDQLENIKYNNNTDGYTAYVLKQLFPKSLGYCNFSGKEVVVIYDQQGRVINDCETKNIGVLNPKAHRFSFEFWVKIASDDFTDNQIIFKKFNNEQDRENGFICYLTNDIDNDDGCFVNFLIYIDGDYTHSKCAIKYTKDNKDFWQNISISVSSKSGYKKIDFINDGNIVDNSSVSSGKNIINNSFGENFKNINIPLTIGGAFLINSSDMSVSDTLSLNDIDFTRFKGGIDEFRFFHKIRSSKTIKNEMSKNIYSQNSLKLYLKFNEPAGDYQNSCLVIDASGNKLHGVIYEHTDSFNILQDTTGFKVNTDTPMVLERIDQNPVLNSAYTKTIDIREKLIEKAKDYDSNNPNLIFNLMPRHYFLNSSEFQSLPVFSNDSEYINSDSIVDEDSSLSLASKKNVTLSPKIPANNDLVNIVLIWARFFDQLKMYIGSITNMLNIDYDSINKEKIVGMQIPILCKMYGIKFKELLPTPTKQKLDNENLKYEDVVSEYSIRKIQNILWQRFLINTQDFLRSKGTISSVESTFNSFGIDYTKFIDVKEYSSYNILDNENNFTLSKKKKNTVDFGNKVNLMLKPEYSDSNITSSSINKMLLKIKDIKSQEVKSGNITESWKDGFGLNWSIEVFFNFKDIINEKAYFDNKKFGTPSEYFKSKQNILRIDQNESPVLSATFENYNRRDSQVGKVSINIQPIKNNSNYNIQLDIPNVNIFDLPKFMCITQSVDEETKTIKYSATIDSIGQQIVVIDSKKSTAYVSVSDLGQLTFSSNKLNVAIGSYNYAGYDYLANMFINDIDTNFQGEIIKIRLWNKELNSDEISVHLKDIDSIGVKDNNALEHLISDFEIRNISSVIENNTKVFTLEDLSNNVYYDEVDNKYSSLNECSVIIGNTNQDDSVVVSLVNLLCKVRNIKFDEPRINNRVNVLSYSKDSNRKLAKNSNVFPINSVPSHFIYDKVARASIEMSIVKVINNDISNIISDLNTFTSEISNNQNLFEYNYKSLEKLREKYFEKFSDKNLVNYSSIGNIFKYFDNIMYSILYDIIPSRLKFEGFNYVYESHVLERSKYQYKYNDSNKQIASTSDFASRSRDYSFTRRGRNYDINRTMS